MCRMEQNSVCYLTNHYERRLKKQQHYRTISQHIPHFLNFAISGRQILAQAYSEGRTNKSLKVID